MRNQHRVCLFHIKSSPACRRDDTWGGFFFSRRKVALLWELVDSQSFHIGFHIFSLGWNTVFHHSDLLFRRSWPCAVNLTHEMDCFTYLSLSGHRIMKCFTTWFESCNLCFPLDRRFTSRRLFMHSYFYVLVLLVYCYLLWILYRFYVFYRVLHK